jgi:predicted MPP superfamily phosphohydrolase
LFSHPFARAIIAVVIAVAIIHLFSALTRDRVIEYKQITVKSPNVSPSINGYTAAFITDLHGSTEDTVSGMVKELSEWGPDVILLGGDYSGQKDLPGVFKRLSQIGAPDGIYGVEGNHDDFLTLREAMREGGAKLLENSGVSLRPGLYLGGTADLWRRVPDVAAALSGAVEGDFILMLSHNPDTAMAHDFSGVNLALCGHTHSGELSLFGVWSPAMGLVSDYGQRFRSGWAKSAAGTDVYVSNGVGRHSPLRVFAPPQVILVTLEAENPST